jgi:hypothetical protein
MNHRPLRVKCFRQYKRHYFKVPAGRSLCFILIPYIKPQVINVVIDRTPVGKIQLVIDDVIFNINTDDRCNNIPRPILNSY